MSRGHDSATRIFSVLQMLLGIAILVVTVYNGGGPLSLGFILGLALIAVGLVRLHLQRRIGDTR